MSSNKRDIKYIHLFPLTYWFKRYAIDIKSMIYRLVLFEIYSLILVFSLYGSSIQYLFLYIMSRLAFVSIYEIGYFLNDYFFENTIITITKQEKYILFFSSLIRIVFTTIIIILLYINCNICNIQSYIVCLFMTQSIFLIHNILNEQKRFITFFFLQLLNYTFIYFLIPMKIFDGIMLSLPFALGWTISYAYKKNTLIVEQKWFEYLFFKKNDLLFRRTYIFYVILVTLNLISTKEIFTLIIFFIFLEIIVKIKGR